MIDLHSHTDRSDGALSPRRLVELARDSSLSALAITDHDTLAGFDEARPHAVELGLDLICGVELSAKFRGQSVHVLGYFLDGPADAVFLAFLDELADTRRDRNKRLAARLREMGLDIRLDEAEALGRTCTGRPHFARLLIAKGYVGTYRQAFEKYLDESAPGFVDRHEPSLAQLCRRIADSGGTPSWAHPGNLLKRWEDTPRAVFEQIASEGVGAVECFHPDHSYEQAEVYLRTARELGLGVSGGSDFHGPSPTRVALGGLRLDESLLIELRQLARQTRSTALS